jgi:hypothetical protein
MWKETIAISLKSYRGTGLDRDFCPLQLVACLPYGFLLGFSLDHKGQGDEFSRKSIDFNYTIWPFLNSVALSPQANYTD